MKQTLPLESFVRVDPQSWPLWQLLNPRRLARAVLASLAAGLLLSVLLVRLWSVPLWIATAVVLVALLPVGIRKWQQDYIAYDTTVMWLSVLITVQGVHSIEHLVQWTQFHILLWPMRQSSGLLSPANAEWVHFAWNWMVLLVVVVLIRGGMRNPWMWLLLAVALFHAVEHSYTFLRYQLILGELRRLGLVTISAQGLSGILGRDGLLARSDWARDSWFCRIPGVTTAIRLDIHFWWNALEIALLMIGGHLYLRRLPGFAPKYRQPNSH
jgi:hypothetical protein